MRMTCSTAVTKILPSPILAGPADCWMASSTASRRSSVTTVSILIFGRKSTTYSAPRYSSVCPFWRPKPLTSVTVMPDTPAWARASRTSSSLNGRMIAVISFMFASRWWSFRPLRPAFGTGGRPGHAWPGATVSTWPLHDGGGAPIRRLHPTSWGRSCRPGNPLASLLFALSFSTARPPARRWLTPGRKRRGVSPAPLPSVAVVQLVFQRVRGRAELGDFLHLQRDVAVDEVVAHDAAGLEELAVRVERFEGLVQAGADLRDVLLFLRRQVVQVLVARRARVDLVTDAVQAGHHQRGEGQVAGLQRIGEADLDAAGLRVGHPRDAAGGRAVAGRVGQHHRRLEARHQALVAVGACVGESVDRAGVLEDAADVPQRQLRQAAVAVAGVQVLAVLAQRLVHVHAAAVVADDRLRHEGDGLAVAVGDVLDDVLHGQQLVGLAHERVELGADLALAGGGHLVVVDLDLDAGLFQGLAHLGAQVVQGV